MDRIIKRIPLPEEFKDVPGIKMELAMKQMFELLSEKMAENIIATKEDWTRITKYVMSVFPEYDDIDKHNLQIH